MSAEYEVIALRMAVIGAAVAGFVAMLFLAAAAIRLQRDGFKRRVNRQMRDLFIAIDPARLWAMQWLLALAVACIVGALSFNVYATAAAAVLSAALPRVVLSRLYQHRLQSLRHQIPDFLMLVAGALRSGSGLSVSLARAAASSPAPTRQEFERLLGELRLGTPLGDALEALERRVRVEEITLLATALRVGADTGGPLALALESLSDGMRRRLALEARIRALTAQGRMQAWIMALLPAVVLALLALVDPPSFDELALTNGGRTVLAAVFVAQIIGFRFVRRIVSIEV